MERVIKFRAWNIPNKQMYFDVQNGVLAKNEKNEFVLGVSLGTLLKDVGNIVMQFTGLTDKNGKEIYEGDKCKFHYNTSKWLVSFTFTVIFKGGAFYAYWEREMMGKTEQHFDLLSKYDLSKVKVIGNIHENPELLC